MQKYSVENKRRDLKNVFIFIIKHEKHNAFYFVDIINII